MGHYLRPICVSVVVVLLAGFGAVGALAQQVPPTAPTDGPARFGALEAVQQISLSPDGTQVAFIAPSTGQGNDLFVVATTEGAAPRRILRASGDPERLSWCRWASGTRLVCSITGRQVVVGRVLSFNNIIAVDAAGGNLTQLSTRRNADSVYADWRGGAVIDWLPGEQGSILMMRSYVPEARGTFFASDGGGREGMGVDRVNTADASVRRVEAPRRDAVGYFSDRRGTVRLMATQAIIGDAQLSDTIRYFYRPTGGGQWAPLTTYNVLTEEGFLPQTVDAATNRAIGYRRANGRLEAAAITLDAAATITTLFAHPEVDVDDIIEVGRDRRVIGFSYATDRRFAEITDTRLRSMATALGRALGGRQILFLDASADESNYLIFAGSDVDPGTYYLYTPSSRQLRPLLAERPQLAGITLSNVRPITYPAADGIMIPGYLTLPPGRSDARGLPAIVMPHGGPSARDEWGFDWLVQHFAAQGYAVLQPNFRGSSGYGDVWYQRNGFQSWRTAIGDIVDGGRWLTGAQGTDAARLSIVGWSYGGYAALQSAVLQPDMFRAIVAIAPVTDLAQLRTEENRFITGRINRDYIGTGPHIREGSPAQNAAAITVPVLLFHGSEDQNVDIEQARTMRSRLADAGRTVELVEYPGLAHSLNDSTARTDMLRRISAFLPR